MLYPIYLKHPTEVEEIKKSIGYLIKNYTKDDKIYVYYASKQAFNFYFKEPVSGKNIFFGRGYRNQSEKYVDEIMALKGRIWIVFSHVHGEGEEKNEEKYILDNLKRNGVRILTSRKFTGSSVYLIEHAEEIINMLLIDNDHFSMISWKKS